MLPLLEVDHLEIRAMLVAVREDLEMLQPDLRLVLLLELTLYARARMLPRQMLLLVLLLSLILM